MNINEFWKDVIEQNRERLPGYFCRDAVIRWHCTNEQFTVEEYVRANCDYPGNWLGEIERIEENGSLIILAGRVFPEDRISSFHVVSFIRLNKGLIAELDEYWGDDGEAPKWRKEMGIGKPIEEHNNGR